MEGNAKTPQLEGHDQKLDEGKLVIDWMSNPPAPYLELYLLLHQSNIVNGLLCADTCRLSMCQNMVKNEKENKNDNEEEHDSEEESDTHAP